ncbi:ATP10 protein-domain-containing protein [Bisporella sp. PMI_857]|nr:ATP10 protein-domain-containing protein [Bisporella sp. PMI_857]
MFITRQSLRQTNAQFDAAACLACQWRTFSNSYRYLAEKQAPSTPSPSPKPDVLLDAPRSYGKAVTEFVPKPLDRPIGLPQPPAAGENTGIDTRSLKQRRDDFVDYDKHIEKRKDLTKKMATPYFRDWSNMRLHNGKSFLAPPRLFKAGFAQYFPNYFGQTLHKDKGYRDTTPLFEGKVSVVSVYSSAWAEGQANTFTDEKNNPELHQILKSSSGSAQLVRINVEENPLKNALVKLFMPGLRAKLGEENWGRYFLVKNNVPEHIREAIGYLNLKVAYTYLLDDRCRIRWAASGPAEGDEKSGLVNGVRKLVEEIKLEKASRAAKAAEAEAQKKVASAKVKKAPKAHV